jgi:hypothetical protein
MSQAIFASTRKGGWGTLRGIITARWLGSWRVAQEANRVRPGRFLARYSSKRDDMAVLVSRIDWLFCCSAAATELKSIGARILFAPATANSCQARSLEAKQNL